MEPKSSLQFAQQPAIGPYFVKLIQSKPSYPISFRFILILSSNIILDLASGVFPLNVYTRNVYAFL
jgi:hypothetical protein